MTRVYSYWCEPASRSDFDLIDTQIRLAADYRYALARVDATYRGEQRALDHADDRVARTDAKLDAMRRYAAAMGDKHPKIEIAVATMNRCKRRLKELRASNRATVEWPALIDAIRERRNVAVRAARAAASDAGLYWGTYLLIEDAHDVACRSIPIWDDVKVKPRRGDGAIGVQLQSTRPLSGAGLLGVDTRAMVDPEPYALGYRVDGFAPRGEDGIVNRSGAVRPKRLRQLSIRVGSEGKRNTPAWCRLHVLMHRAIPDDAKISWVRVHRVKCGLTWRYSAQFVVDDGVTKNANAPTDQAVGVDIGWRRVDGGIRIGFALGFDGVTHELVIEDEVTRRQGKSDDLRSIRDKRRDVERAALVAYRATISAGASEASDSWHLATLYMFQWNRVGRFAALYGRWKNERFDGDGAAFDAVTAWLKQDRHLLEWEANNVRRMRLQIKGRREQWVSMLCQRYGTVCMERVIRIDQMRGRATADDEQKRKAAVAHTETSPGELMSWLARQARVAVRVDPRNTTSQCSCGVVRVIDQKPLMLGCASCGLVEDQDLTAARNILRLGLELASGGTLGPDGSPLAPVISRRKVGTSGGRANRKSIKKGPLASAVATNDGAT